MRYKRYHQTEIATRTKMNGDIGLHWIDIINEKKYNPSFLYSKSKEYPRYLYNCKQIIKKQRTQNKDIRLKNIPGKYHYILNEEIDDFYINFMGLLQENNFEEKKIKEENITELPDGIRDDDILLTTQLFENNGIHIMNLEKNEIQYFEEVKDHIHEEYFGDYTRLSKMKNFDQHHRWIPSKNKKKVDLFMKELKQQFDEIVNNRDKNTRKIKFSRMVFS